MAIQILPEEPGFGHKFATGLGQGLSSTLQALTNMKIKDIAQRQQHALQQQEQNRTSNLLQKFGLSPEASEYVATLPAKEQWAAVQELSGLGALGALAPQQQEAQPQVEQPMQETSRPLSSILGEMGNQPRSVQELLALSGLGQQLPQQSVQQQAPNVQPVQQQPAPQQKVQAAPQLPVQSEPKEPQAKLVAKEPLTKKEVNRPISPAEKIALNRQLKTQKEAEKIMNLNQKEINKETQDYYKAVIKEDHAAKKSDIRLGRLEQLVKKGNLPNATWYRLLKDLSEEGLGINSALAGAALGTIVGGGAGTLFGPAGTAAGITAGQAGGAAVGGLIGSLINPVVKGIASAGLAAQRSASPDVEEFEKLSTDFIREAKEIFGARVTDRDLQAFMQIIPTLMQTDAGKNRIIENMRAFNTANHLRYNAMKQIIDANGGKRPANLEFLVEEFTEPQLEKLAEQFKQGIVTTTALPEKQLAARSGKQVGVIGAARRKAGL